MEVWRWRIVGGIVPSHPGRCQGANSPCLLLGVGDAVMEGEMLVGQEEEKRLVAIIEVTQAVFV
jgi:hypothetical protein